MVELTPRPLRFGFRRRSQIQHNTSLCSGISTQDDSRCSDHDVADVDCIWHHDRFRRFRRIPEHRFPGRELPVAMDVGFHFYPTVLRHDSGLFLS